MPSDANGVYSLPTGYLAVTGETIQASQHNPPLEDLATAMTARLTRSGAAPMTGALKVVDGSVGLPSVQFSNAPSTGFYKTTNGFGISVAGTKVAEFGAGGIVSGARWLGELVPFTGYTAPALTVFPFGQTLSRTTYADLWAFAQNEITAGNTFYNNGDGSTTFGIGDLRGRHPAGLDNMGGTAAGRLTTTTMASAVLGGTGGAQTHTLTLTEIPTGITSTQSSSFSITVLSTSSQICIGESSSTTGGGNIGFPIPASVGTVQSNGTVAENTVRSVSTNTGNGAHSSVQPTIFTNYVLFAGA